MGRPTENSNEECKMPSKCIIESRGFEVETGRFSKQGSLDSLPEPERPPLRRIDTYCKPECLCLPKRYTIALLACIGFIISFGMRCNMISAMISETNSALNWTVATHRAIDSTFFFSYLVAQVFGGFLAFLYPASQIFGTAIFISSFLNLLAPGAVSCSPMLYLSVQLFRGLVEGVTYPACHGIWKFWAPPLERTRLATLVFCGSFAGILIGMPLSRILTIRLGWTASFYFYGVFGIIWYGFWLWLSFEKPLKHPSISAKELRYIEDSLGQGQINQPKPTFKTIPWRKFITSMPVYAIIVANFCKSWNFYLLVLFKVRFMHEAFQIPFAQLEEGVMGAMPYILMTIIVPCGGLLADCLRQRGIVTTTNVRKLFSCSGFGMEALFFLVVAYGVNNQNATAARIALIIGVPCSGLAISGFNVNHLDIAPRYASILMGISNGIGTTAGLLVPIIVDYIIWDKRPHNWCYVFVMAACVHFIGATFYAVFCSGELQPWADSALEEKASGNSLGEINQTKSPVLLPPQVMQTQLIKQPSLNAGQPIGWNYDQLNQHAPPYQLPPPSSPTAQ